MKFLANPERGGVLVKIKDATVANGEREQGNQMLLAVAVLEEINRRAKFVVEDEKLPTFIIEGWIARKAGTNTVIGSQPSVALIEQQKQLEFTTGQTWELRVKTIRGIGRVPFLRPSRVKKQKNADK